MAMRVDTDTKRVLVAFILAIFGLMMAGYLTYRLFTEGMKDAKDVVAVAGLFTGITGTLVGTFLGVHAGAAGRADMAKAHENAMNMLKEMAHQSGNPGSPGPPNATPTLGTSTANPPPAAGTPSGVEDSSRQDG